MKRRLLIFLSMLSVGAAAQDITFPDPALKALLLSATATNNVAKDAGGTSIVVDANSDNEIQQSEALAVYTLEISNSGLTDVAGIEYFTNLQSLYCSNNSLTSLYLNDNAALTYLDCTGNSLNMLFIKNGQTETLATGTWPTNPSLVYICADEAQVPSLMATAPASITINSFCSFVPGGDYNTITGTLTIDTNGNGCDALDTKQPFVKVDISNGTDITTVFTDENGRYYYYTQQTGSYTITPTFEETGYFSAVPASEVINITAIDNTVVTQDFCVTEYSTTADVEVVMAPVVHAVPGQEAVYKLVYKNKGNAVLSGQVECTWNYTIFDFYGDSFSPFPDELDLNGDFAIYKWNYTSLQPLESREVLVTMGVHGPFDVYPVHVGDIIPFQASAGLPADALPLDNDYVFDQYVAASAPANSIMCIEGDTQPDTGIGEYLHYIVNFSPDGAGDATSIVIEQDIDPAQFDISTLQILNSSHPASARINGNTARFVFQEANLTADDHGNILFKVKTRPNLQSGASVSSNARVFYDYSQPVQTNTATTQFGTMGVDGVYQDTIALYPNPASDKVTITAQSNIKTIALYDLQGRLLQAAEANAQHAEIDLTGRAAGVYFVKITTGKGATFKKLIKE